MVYPDLVVQVVVARARVLKEGQREWLMCVFDFPTRVRTSATCSGKNDDVELFIDELTKHETYTTEGL